MGHLRHIRDGGWWLRSTIDPRWNSSGRGQVGGFVMPQEVKDEIERKKAELGEEPADLEFGYMKD